MARTKAKKQKIEKIDGLGPSDLQAIHKAVRQVWSWSKPWRLAKARAMHEDGFPRCENKKCPKKGKPVPKVFVDHKQPVGEVGGPNYIQKMFIPSKNLQCLCKPCHDAKTKEERTPRAKVTVSKRDKSPKKAPAAGKDSNEDFY